MSRQRDTTSDKVFYFFNNTLLVIAFAAVVYPLIFIVSASFSSGSAVMGGRVWLLPVDPTLDAYRAVFRHPFIMMSYANTIFYTVAGTSVNVVLTLLAAYPLSRPDFRMRNIFMFVFAFTMFFSGGLIPTYLLVRSLGLLDTRWAMILPTGLSVWNVIITRTYLQATISRELLEASKLDGCSDFRFVLAVVLPLSGAIVAVIMLFYAVGHWNAFFNAFLFLYNRRLFPLQLILREILILGEIDVSMVSATTIEEMIRRDSIRELLKYAVIIVASAPVLAMYPFVQKYFVKGVMIGAIKG